MCTCFAVLSWYRALRNRVAPQTAVLYVRHCHFPYPSSISRRRGSLFLKEITVTLLFIIVGYLTYAFILYQVPGKSQMISWTAQLLFVLKLFQASHILHHCACSCWVQLHTFSVYFLPFLCVPATGPRTTNLRGIYYRNHCLKLNWRQVLREMHVASCFHLYNPTNR